MKMLFPLMMVLALAAVGLVGGGVPGLRYLFGVVIPYLSIVLFVGGCVYRVVNWAKAPVPYCIPTTCGQQKSLPWIKANNLESPYNSLGVVGRMALEIFLFRSLFRNTRSEVRDGRVIHGGTQWLWLAGLAFHWSFLVVVLRHLRFFTQPVPGFVTLLQSADGLFQVGVPVFYVTTVLLLLAVTYLFLRRVFLPQVRYISLPSDYFPLFLMLGIGLTGALMRHFFRVDVEGVKELAMGLVGFNPVVPQGVSALFFAHLFLVSSLLAYFPVSKMMHMGGIFLSPTRNLANDSRSRRHINPWDYPVKVHTYQEWQEEFRDKIVAAGLPLDEEADKRPAARV